MSQTTTPENAPSVEAIIDAINASGQVEGEAKPSRDDRRRRVIVRYGSLGYLTVTPDNVLNGGIYVAAARCEGRLSRRNGFHHQTVREALRSAEIYPL